VPAMHNSPTTAAGRYDATLAQGGCAEGCRQA
jgi:hypothetical protein